MATNKKEGDTKKGAPSSSNKKESKPIYGPTEQAKESPVRLKVNDSWVGVGGKIVVKRPAPAKDETIKECTPDQYKALYERGLKHLVQCSE